jgi:ribosomal protein S27E
MSQTQSPNARPVLRELKCPQCGASVPQFSADAQTLACPRCHATLNEDMEGIKAARGVKLPNARVPIKVGQKLTFEGVAYFVLGRVLYQGWDPDDSSDHWSWNEWQLGSSDGRLVWLAHDEHGLSIFNKMRIREPFDAQGDASVPVGNGQRAMVTERYPAKIVGVEGELSWKAGRGDKLMMVEAKQGVKSYSVQVSPEELEVYSGQVLSKEAITAALGEDAAKEMFPPFFTLGVIVATVCILFACVSGLLGLVVSGSGEAFTTQTVTVNRGQESEFPVTFATAGRPVIVDVSINTPLAENTFADVDISITAPNEVETYIVLQEFWHETGVDEGEFWREQQLSGSDTFVPAMTGDHTVTVALDEGSQLESATVQIGLKINHISPTFLWGYAIIVAIIGGIIFFFSRLGKG